MNGSLLAALNEAHCVEEFSMVVVGATGATGTPAVILGVLPPDAKGWSFPLPVTEARRIAALLIEAADAKDARSSRSSVVPSENAQQGRGIEDVQAPRSQDDHDAIEVCERLLYGREILRFLGMDETTERLEGVAALLGQYRKESRRLWPSRFAKVIAGLMIARSR